MAPMYVLSILALTLTSVIAEERRAVVFLQDSRTYQNIGNLTFVQDTHNGVVRMNGTIKELGDGKHGFHIHEKGDISDGCKAAGGHFNPTKVDHGAPNDTVRHVGDLGNIEVVNKEVEINFTDGLISLHGPNSIIGRAVVVHEKVDDLGKGGHPDSLKTGNAGGRVACGVVGIQSPVDPWEKGTAASVEKSATTALISLIVVALMKQFMM